MKKLVFALLLIPVLGFSQVEEVSTGKIELGTSGKNFFIKDGEGYKLNQYKQVFSNQEAIDRIKKARTNKTFAEIITYTGSFCVGFGIGVVVSVHDQGKGEPWDTFEKRDRNLGWTIAGIGAGITLTSIPLWMGYSKNIKKGIEIENGLNETEVSELRLNVNGDGFGIAYQF